MLSMHALLLVIHHDSVERNMGRCYPGIYSQSTCPRSHGGNELALGSAPRAPTPELASPVSDPGGHESGSSSKVILA